LAQTRIEPTFSRLRERGEGALVTYLATGDPSLDETVELVRALEDAGADVVELGMPFSDPVADGPTIQAACQRALAAGATPDAVFKTIARVRARSEVPIVIMTYVNLVHRPGYRAFAARAAEAGADAVLITDLPVGAADEWIAECEAADLDTVFLVAPTSRPETLRLAGRRASGFVYCVSRAGTTGARDSLPEELPEFLAQVRAATTRPLCVGFGISSDRQVAELLRHADGVVVGSALVDVVAAAPPGSRVQAARDFCRKLKQATKSHA